MRVQSRKTSAGLLMFRRTDSGVEVFLVHPGGPFWAKKDLGSWGIPKGEFVEPEDPLAAARREFQEETGFDAAGPFVPLGDIRQKSGKVVSGWAFEGDCDPALLKSNTFELEWPIKSGRRMEVPEVDRGAWFPIDRAREKILDGQTPFLDRLLAALDSRGPAIH